MYSLQTAALCITNLITGCPVGLFYSSTDLMICSCLIMLDQDQNEQLPR